MKILIYRLSSIGDIVLTSPVIRCLKKAFPEAEIHYLTRKKYAELLSTNPYIDYLHLVDHSAKEIINKLKSEKFDYLIDLHRNIRSISTRFSLKTKYSTFPKLNFKKFLFTKFKINKMPNLHIVDRYFKAVEFLNVKNDGQGLDLFIEKKTTLPENLIIEKNYISFAIGATYETKRYPISLIKEFIEKATLPVYIIGGVKEKKDGEFLQKGSKGKAVSLCAMLSLQQSALLIKQSSLHISNDTGMMHFAAALKKPLLSIWGNTVPDFGMYPYYPEELKNQYSIIERKDLSCRPCSKLGYHTCPKKHFKCMNEISPNQILEEAERLLNM